MGQPKGYTDRCSAVQCSVGIGEVKCGVVSCRFCILPLHPTTPNIPLDHSFEHKTYLKRWFNLNKPISDRVYVQTNGPGVYWVSWSVVVIYNIDTTLHYITPPLGRTLSIGWPYVYNVLVHIYLSGNHLSSIFFQKIRSVTSPHPLFIRQHIFHTFPFDFSFFGWNVL